jgi:hypothetical protein
MLSIAKNSGLGSWGSESRPVSRIRACQSWATSSEVVGLREKIHSAAAVARSEAAIAALTMNQRSLIASR